MNAENLKKFKDLYEVYKQTDDYNARVKQFAIVSVNKEIIEETLHNEPLLNEHLTGFIQMFKYGCSDQSFDKYLAQNITDQFRRETISEKAYEADEWGYTGAGLNSISGLTPEQLATIKVFIQTAFTVKTVDEAISLCTNFDNENIAYVKSGIYSPWLYYINPKIFPIINQSHEKFREWIGIPADYPAYIKAFNELKTLVEEKELGVIDMFAHNFDKYYKLPVGLHFLNLNGKKLYKMSHGIFRKDKRFKNTGIADIFEKNHWISINKYTGKGQAEDFIKANIGDYVYVCYGGDNLHCFGKIKSASKPLDAATDKIINGEGEWIYREIELLFPAIISSVKELKTDKRFFMPSGNSTFYEVPPDQLDFMNKKIFTPKCNLAINNGGTGGVPTPPDAATPDANNRNKTDMAINTILYGPPGTGKTFSTIDISLQILKRNAEEIEREEAKEQFFEYQNQRRIFFTTFHQNMAYEDFIEGIKPMKPEEEDDEFLKYEIQDGLFMKACIEATYNYIRLNFEENETVAELIDFNSLYDSLYYRISDAGAADLETVSGGTVTATVTSQGNFAIRHEGRDKPYTVSRDRLERIYEAYPNPHEITNILKAFRNVIGGCNATAYWSVLNEIANGRDQATEQSGEGEATVQEGAELSYEDKRKVVVKYWEKKENVVILQDKSEPFVFIIDEINRGNVSQIFGELITLIEDDKRMGNIETLFIDLPYSKHSFSIPPNLYLIGTMNTADRSVEALDTALRRRFTFIPKWPDAEKLVDTEDGISLSAMLTALNDRLKVLKDADHTIGHAWLWNISNLETLQKVFANKVLPLLQEYFYNDYEKLGLVLGDNFFKPHKQVNSDVFASFSGGNGLSGQYDQSWQYELKKAVELTVADFQSLYALNTQ